MTQYQRAIIFAAVGGYLLLWHALFAGAIARGKLHSTPSLRWLFRLTLTAAFICEGVAAYMAATNG